MSGFAPPPTVPDLGQSGISMIVNERHRQVQSEGYMAWHDDRHTHDEIVMAAVQYALPDRNRELSHMANTRTEVVPTDWPWEDEAWKPTPDDRVRELVKAGALIAAEIDRLLRSEA